MRKVIMITGDMPHMPLHITNGVRPPLTQRYDMIHHPPLTPTGVTRHPHKPPGYIWIPLRSHIPTFGYGRCSYYSQEEDHSQ